MAGPRSGGNPPGGWARLGAKPGWPGKARLGLDGAAACSGIVQRVFKALVCSVLFFIAIGAIGMWLTMHRRKSGGSAN